MIRLTINVLFLAGYGLRIAQGFHLGIGLAVLWPYVGVWVSWVMLSRLRVIR